MLRLKRKKGEAIRMGEDIRIEVLQVKNDQVLLGIECPSTMRVLREELYEATRKENLIFFQRAGINHFWDEAARRLQKADTAGHQEQPYTVIADNNPDIRTPILEIERAVHDAAAVFVQELSLEDRTNRNDIQIASDRAKACNSTEDREGETLWKKVSQYLFDLETTGGEIRVYEASHGQELKRDDLKG